MSMKGGNQSLRTYKVCIFFYDSLTRNLVDKAKGQLLRRFTIINGIAQLLDAQLFYAGTIFVPRVPDNKVTEYREKVPWRTDSIAEEQTEQKDANHSVFSVAPDILLEQGSCIASVHAF